MADARPYTHRQLLADYYLDRLGEACIPGAIDLIRRRISGGHGDGRDVFEAAHEVLDSETGRNLLDPDAPAPPKNVAKAVLARFPFASDSAREEFYGRHATKLAGLPVADVASRVASLLERVEERHALAESHRPPRSQSETRALSLAAAFRGVVDPAIQDDHVVSRFGPIAARCGSYRIAVIEASKLLSNPAWCRGLTVRDEPLTEVDQVAIARLGDRWPGEDGDPETARHAAHVLGML